jgi:hypothetical protein
MVSFYSLPSLVMKHEKHRDIHTAYAFYYASDVLFSPGGSDEDASKKKDILALRLNDLMKDAMIIAKQVNMRWLFFHPCQTSTDGVCSTYRPSLTFSMHCR